MHRGSLEVGDMLSDVSAAPMEMTLLGVQGKVCRQHTAFTLYYLYTVISCRVAVKSGSVMVHTTWQQTAVYDKHSNAILYYYASLCENCHGRNDVCYDSEDNSPGVKLCC